MAPSAHRLIVEAGCSSPVGLSTTTGIAIEIRTWLTRLAVSASFWKQNRTSSRSVVDGIRSNRIGREPGAVRRAVAADDPAAGDDIERRLAASEDDLDEVLLGRRLAAREQHAAGGEIDRLAAELVPCFAAGVEPAYDGGHDDVDAEEGALIVTHEPSDRPRSAPDHHSIEGSAGYLILWPAATPVPPLAPYTSPPRIREDPAMRDPRYDILFEPVPLGPVTARNRFFQVPHCNGMGHHHPTAHAHMRGVKAEGGWAVVCTEEVEIHPSSEVSPYIEGRLWDDADIPALARMTEKIHEHGSLAGIEPCHNGIHGANMYTRETGMAVGHLPVSTHDPVQVRRMDLDDIAALRRWHRAAVRRSLEAGFDVVYVYSAHGLNTIGQFLSRKYNGRRDGYGGSLENRARLLREILEDTLDEVDGRAAVACRITVDELVGADGIDRPDIEGVLRPCRRAARRVGLRRRRVGERLVDVAVRPGGGPRGVRPRPEGAHVEAGRRRRPLHLARHDGADGARTACST